MKKSPCIIIDCINGGYAGHPVQEQPRISTMTGIKASDSGIPEGLKINVGHSVNTTHGYHLGLLKFKEVVEEKNRRKGDC